MKCYERTTMDYTSAGVYSFEFTGSLQKFYKSLQSQASRPE